MACAAAAAESLHRVTDEQILEQMLAHFGILAYVAAALGISRTTIHKRVNNSPQLQKVRDEAREAAVRMAEKQLLSAIDAGASWAIRYTLNTLGRAEGFGPPFRQPRVRKPKDAGAEPRVEVLPELDEIRGEIADSAQMRLIQAIEDGQPWAIKYCLSTLGRSKGYGPPLGESLEGAQTISVQPVAPANDAQIPATQSEAAQTAIPKPGRIETVPQGAQTLDQPALAAAQFTSAGSEESADASANPAGAQTHHGASRTRHHGDPATRANRRRERKLRKQRVRENRRGR